jgi:hypothetical protein
MLFQDNLGVSLLTEYAFALRSLLYGDGDGDGEDDGARGAKASGLGRREFGNIGPWWDGRGVIVVVVVAAIMVIVVLV